MCLFKRKIKTTNQSYLLARELGSELICELKCPSIFLLGLAVGNGLQSAPGDVLISQKMVLHGGLTVVLGLFISLLLFLALRKEP